MAAQALNFKVQTIDGTARTGLLSHARGTLETPALLVYTRRGSELYLTADMQKHLGSEGQSSILDATQFLGNPTPETLSKAPGGARGFCALEGKFLAVTARDSAIYNYRHWRKGTNAGVRVEAFSGSQELTPAAFLRVAQLFEPDLLVPLSDEVPAEAEEEKLKSSARRSLRWLDQTLSTLESSKGATTGVLAPIQGGTSAELRRWGAEEARKRDGVFGYAICGMGTGETAPQQLECTQAAVAALPVESFKLMQGSLTPGAILAAVAAGIDCFDATYASQVTAEGFALRLDGETRSGESLEGHDDTKINLLNSQFKEDVGPLVPGCSCFTCQTHTRAYLYHLLVVHEMTAQVLLELHNLHQLLCFFRRIRATISQNQFSQFHRAFIEKRSRMRSGAAGA